MIKGSIYLVVSFVLFIVAYLHMHHSKTLRYLPLGDSYTIGTGASEEQAWPKLLTLHLNEKGIGCRLLANPARNGYSSLDLIREELPLAARLQPDFVTLLIGVNDWVRGVTKEEYSKNLTYILDSLQKIVKSKKHILLVTIPDFGVTPYGKNFSNGREIRKGIAEFNTIIKEQAALRGLFVADVFAVSQKMGEDPALVSRDGLHPSAKGYASWEEVILQKTLEVLK